MDKLVEKQALFEKRGAAGYGVSANQYGIDAASTVGIDVYDPPNRQHLLDHVLNSTANKDMLAKNAREYELGRKQKRGLKKSVHVNLPMKGNSLKDSNQVPVNDIFIAKEKKAQDVVKPEGFTNLEGNDYRK